MDVQDIIGTARRAAPHFSEGAEVRLVGDGDRDVEPECGRQPLAKGNIDPTQVRTDCHDTVGRSHESGDGNANTDRGVDAGLPGTGTCHEVGEVVDDVVDG